jgi:type IV pilus assembly protein PilB
MRDMSAEPYLLAATLRLVVAQRLVRQLCQQPGCRKTRSLSPTEAAALGQPDAAGREVYEPGGCVYCAGRGYAGRIGLFEVMPVDEDLAARISAGAGETDLVAELRRRGHQSLREDAAAKVYGGLITAREGLAVVDYF